MRILTAFAFALLFAPLAAAQASQPDCNKAPSEMTPDEYVACVSVGGVKNLTPSAPADAAGGEVTYSSSNAPTGAGRGVRGVASSESAACSQAKAKAGGNARGSCSCTQVSGGRYECTVPTAVIRD